MSNNTLPLGHEFIPHGEGGFCTATGDMCHHHNDGGWLDCKLPRAAHAAPLNGREARDAFLAKVRARVSDAPYFVDHGGGFGGSTVVCGPTLRAGFILQSIDDKRPEQLAENLNGAWAAGYEQGLADARAKTAGEQTG